MQGARLWSLVLVLHTPQHSQNNSDNGMKRLLGMMGRFITFIKVMFTHVETQIILYVEYAPFVMCPLYCNLNKFYWKIFA